MLGGEKSGGVTLGVVGGVGMVRRVGGVLTGDHRILWRHDGTLGQLLIFLLKPVKKRTDITTTFRHCHIALTK